MGAASQEDYPPIGDYALIGDCRSGALISRAGSVDWLCLPEFFSEAVFASLLDAGDGGRLVVRPTAPHRVERRYLDATAVLETTFHCRDGVLRVTDCMPVGETPRLQPARELLRRVEVLSGGPEFEVEYRPRPDYGRRPVRLRRQGHLGWRCDDGPRLLLFRAELPLVLAAEERRLGGRFRLPPGSRRYLSLSCTERDVAVVPELGAAADRRLAATAAWWRDWAGRCRYRGPYREIVLRSAVTLKLLTYTLSGAVLAAPTSSLPEEPGGSRNWDYRYCWLRDAAFTLRAFLDLGYRREADAFFGWLLHATRLTWPELAVMYTAYGQPPGAERELDHLAGYRGSRPVRIGNAARGQLQLDIYGELAMAAVDFVRRGGELDRYEARLLGAFGDTVRKKWREPDNGIWEVRGERRHYTYSKLMCWAALNSLIKLHDDGRLAIDRRGFAETRREIAEAIEREGYSRAHNGYLGILGEDWVDAAMLQLVRTGFHPADDPRVRGTFELIWRRLARNGLIKRYQDGFDGQSGTEGAFGVCAFWAVSHLATEGRHREAERLFEHTAACANDVGLFGEEIDPRSGAALGNFPQAFTHVGLIDAAMALAGRAEEHGRDRRRRPRNAP